MFFACIVNYRFMMAIICATGFNGNGFRRSSIYTRHRMLSSLNDMPGIFHSTFIPPQWVRTRQAIIPLNPHRKSNGPMWVLYWDRIVMWKRMGASVTVNIPLREMAYNTTGIVSHFRGSPECQYRKYYPSERSLFRKKNSISIQNVRMVSHGTNDYLFLHAKPWIPGGEISIFTAVIH